MTDIIKQSISVHNNCYKFQRVVIILETHNYVLYVTLTAKWLCSYLLNYSKNVAWNFSLEVEECMEHSYLVY